MSFTENEKAIAPLLAGFFGGAASTVILYPLDLVKVRMQVNENVQLTSNDGKPKTRVTLGKVCRAVIRQEGILGLYQGLTPAVVGSSVSWGGYFFTYEGMRKHYGKLKYPSMNTNHEDLEFGAAENFLLACASGAVMVGITNPVWLIKTRMQLQLKKATHEPGTKLPYKNMIDAARTIVREEGVMALYKGGIPALMLTSHGGVQLAVYEFLKQFFQVRRAERDQSMSVTERFKLSLGFLSMGAASKIVASTVTYPLQVVKSRLQQRVESLEITETGDFRVVKRKYGGVVSTVTRMWKQEGPTGFFKGAIPNALRVAPGAAITFLVYESVMDYCLKKS